MALPLALLAEPLLKIGGNLIDRLIPDKQAAAAAKLGLMKLHQEGELASLAAETELAKGQQAINTIEAGHKSLFVAGWRPFIGWTCGLAFAYHFLIQPILLTVLGAFGIQVAAAPFEMSALLTVLGGMLGIGGLRTIEKIKRIA